MFPPQTAVAQIDPLTVAQFADLARDSSARDRLQSKDARAARRALFSAAALMTLRATVVPPILRSLVAGLPPAQRARFTAYTDPAAVYTAAALAVVFFALALLARRRPLLAACLATAIFVAASVPFVVANPVLIGGGHLGRITLLLVLGRAVTAGFCARFR